MESNQNLPKLIFGAETHTDRLKKSGVTEARTIRGEECSQHGEPLSSSLIGFVTIMAIFLLSLSHPNKTILSIYQFVGAMAVCCLKPLVW